MPITYYVHETERFAIVHAASCARRRDLDDGIWHGPFPTGARARAAAVGTRKDAGECEACMGSDLLPKLSGSV